MLSWALGLRCVARRFHTQEHREPGQRCYGVMVTTAASLCKSIVAVIVTIPTRLADTTPVVFTVASRVLLDCQVNGRPTMTFPLTSTATALRTVVFPFLTLTTFGVTVTFAAGPGCTVMVQDPDLPPLVAVIVAVPAADVDTKPLCVTAAIFESLELQAIAAFPMIEPAASFTVALNVAACPAVSVEAGGDTTTLLGAADPTVTVAVPFWPPL